MLGCPVLLQYDMQEPVHRHLAHFDWRIARLNDGQRASEPSIRAVLYRFVDGAGESHVFRLS